MITEQSLRKYIRKTIEENVNNYLNHEDETETELLADHSKSQVIGNSLEVELNQQANELGSDGKNAPTVAVRPGKEKSGDDFLKGQHQAKFSSKTSQAK